MKATSVRLLWDSNAGDNNGWFVRLIREDGQEIDSIPTGEGCRDRNIDADTARELIEECLLWETVDADESIIEWATEFREE